ncbi:hypothetical protein DW886_14640 [Enterocloster aldenensis]|nr:hypothetical protein DW886_14640 [Enterocloster aldenensis]
MPHPSAVALSALFPAGWGIYPLFKCRMQPSRLCGALFIAIHGTIMRTTLYFFIKVYTLFIFYS